MIRATVTELADRLDEAVEVQERLLALVGETFHVEMPPTALVEAPTVRAFAEVFKHHVDHPGRLERLAERLLQNGHSATASQRDGHRAGASW